MKILNLLLVHTFGQLLIVKESQISQQYVGEGEYQHWAEIARWWIHHLGFIMCKGIIFFDGHECGYVVEYQNDFLDKLAVWWNNHHSIPTMSNVADGEQQFIRVVHESTFYANTSFWNDGQAKAKSLGSSITISGEQDGYLKDDKQVAWLYLETQKESYLMICL